MARRPVAAPKPRFFSNYLRTGALMGALIALLALVGRAVGGDQGMLLLGGVGLLINFVMYWFSDTIAIRAHRAQPVTRAEAPSLYTIVERLTRRAGMPMPRLYVIPSATANAFATGRNPRHAAVAVTDGILQVLNERELEAVLAHELSHVKNRDILIATIAAGVAGLISTVGHVLQFALMFGGAVRATRRRPRRRPGHARLDHRRADHRGAHPARHQPIARVRRRRLGRRAVRRSRRARLALACGSRRRRTSARTSTPGPRPPTCSSSTPCGRRVASIMNLFSTHPPIEERVRRLAAMRV